jgi:hypothetical protein
MPYRDGAERESVHPRKKNTLMLGLGMLALALAGAFSYRQLGAPAGSAHPASQQAHAGAPAIHDPDAGPANFGADDPTPDARLLANWVVATHDNGKHAFLLVDKKDARVYVFTPDGHLKDSAPALMGEAHGDDILPGSGDKPLSQMKPEEKTTPAGRFVAEPGLNSGKEDVVWVDYDAAVSMHRIRPLVARERRLERLASLTTDDNRISFGCINLPVSFYENVVSPTVRKQGAIVYVLPEVKTAQEVFGAFDVNDPEQVAAWRQLQATRVAAARDRALQKVALQRSAR